MKELVQQLLTLLKGSSGHIRLEEGIEYGDFKITGPASFDFIEDDGLLKLTFQKPYPIGGYKILKKNITAIQLTLTELIIEIDWAPDVKIKIR